jgi:hypothetical protein
MGMRSSPLGGGDLGRRIIGQCRRTELFRPEAAERAGMAAGCLRYLEVSASAGAAPGDLGRVTARRPGASPGRCPAPRMIVSAPGELAELDRLDITPWAGGGRSCYIKILPSEVSSRRIRRAAGEPSASRDAHRARLTGRVTTP